MALAEPPVSIAAAPALHPSRPGVPSRLEYLDSLKVLLTILVIAHHAGQAYGPTGGRWPIFEPERAAILGPFLAVNAGFFMGLFFLISAYFLPASFDRKGASHFLLERTVRLGVPLVGVGLLIGALTQTTFELAHLWFVAHLLVYAVLYTAWRALRLPALVVRPPTHRTILGYALLLAGVSAVVSLEFPIDRWVNLLGVLPAEVAHLPQYASLFAIGLLAARGRWLEALPTRTGLLWLAIGVSLAALRYLYALLMGAAPAPQLWSAWESVMCVGLCVGLPVLFREYGGLPRRLLRALAPNAYAAYVVHVAPVVVGLQIALAPVSFDPFTKFALVTLAGVPLSFLLAASLRRLPGVRAVL
jgi:glucans biosynthesis protein C